MMKKFQELKRSRKSTETKLKIIVKKTKDLEKKERDDWDRYHEQQNLINEIQWMKKVQDRLKRDRDFKQREDEERKQRDLEDAQYKEVPYKDEMALCELLISYCLKLSPQEKVIEEDFGKNKAQALEDALKSDEWKKEKLQLVVSRRDKEEDLYAGKPKKNKNQKQQEKPVSGNLPLNHQMEILGYFDSVKVSPPLFISKLPDTLKHLKDKKDYYQNLSTQQLENPSAQNEASKEETKPTEDSPKKQPKRQTKQFQLKEEDFPTI